MSNFDILVALGSRRRSHAFEAMGITLHFRGLSNREVREWLDSLVTEDVRRKSDQIMIATALCNESGEPLYSTDEDRLRAAEAIADWDPSEVVRPLIEKISAASGLKTESIEKK